MTLCEQWAWKPDDQMKIPRAMCSTLVRCAGGDGNLLFKCRPDAGRSNEPRQVERLKEIGEWLKRNGESISAPGRSVEAQSNPCLDAPGEDDLSSRSPKPVGRNRIAGLPRKVADASLFKETSRIRATRW